MKVEGVGINNFEAKNRVEKTEAKNTEERLKDKEKTKEKNDSVQIDLDAFDKIKAQSMAANKKLSNLVRQLLKRQGISHEEALADPKKVEIDKKAVNEAQKLIAEDGAWGIEAVSDRIVDFAKAISGGDREKYELLRDAIIEGFEQAKEELGGYLPEISGKTFERTMEKLADWAEVEMETEA